MDAQERRDSSSENVAAVELIPAGPTCVHYKHIPRSWHQCVHGIGLWAFPEPFKCPSADCSRELRKWKKCHHSRKRLPCFSRPGSLWSTWNESEFGSSPGDFLKLYCLVLNNNKTTCRFYKKIIKYLHKCLGNVQLLYPYKNTCVDCIRSYI